MNHEMVLSWAPGWPRNEKKAVEPWQRSLGQGLANSSPRTGHLLVEMRFYRHTATLIRFRIVCGCVHATTAEWSSCDTVWPAHPKHHLSGSLKEKWADPWSRQTVRWVKCWLKVPDSWCQKKAWVGFGCCQALCDFKTSLQAGTTEILIRLILGQQYGK